MKVGFLVKLGLRSGSGFAPWGLCPHVNPSKLEFFKRKTHLATHSIEILSDGISLCTHSDSISLDTKSMSMSDPQGLISWVPTATKSSEPSP